MKFRIGILAVLSMLAMLTSKPAHLHGQQADAQQHEQHHPGTAQPPTSPAASQSDMAKMMATMNANDQKFDELLKKMNAAQGPAKQKGSLNPGAVGFDLVILFADSEQLRDERRRHEHV